MLKDIDEHIGIPRDRYRMLFYMENAFGILRKNDAENIDGEKSQDYDCIYYKNHDCVFPSEVLVDIMFSLRSGDLQILEVYDLLCISINGSIYTYRYTGVKSWDPNDIKKNFTDLGTDFFSSEKKKILDKLHKNGMVLNVLDGKAISIKDIGLDKYIFYGIERESFPFMPYNMISEFNLYKLEDDKIVMADPSGISFYDMKNVIHFYLKKCKSDNFSVLLFDRKELEMIKDYADIHLGVLYGA